MGSQSCAGCLSERLLNERLRARLNETEREVQELRSHHALSLKGLIRHCEDGSCEMHGSEWRQVKEKVIARALEDLTDEFIEELALVKGIVPRRVKVAARGVEERANAQEHQGLATGDSYA